MQRYIQQQPMQCLSSRQLYLIAILQTQRYEPLTIFLISFSVDYAIYLGIHLQIFIGNLDPNVTEDELKQICIQFGELIYVKIPVGKGCGFVQYAAR